MRFEQKDRQNPQIWHSWFAWYPVKVKRIRDPWFSKFTWVWLEPVERRIHYNVWNESGTAIKDRYEYRFPKEVNYV